MELNQAIKNAIDGNAILFLGSGYSIGAENLSGAKFLSGKSLAKCLCDELDITEDLSLDIASDIYIENKNETQLIEKLNLIYYAKSIGDSHKTIASLPWKRVYTTNYDNVYELASSQISKRVKPITIDEDPSKHIGVNNLCVHINGYIDKLDHDSLKKSFKLTSTSYLTDEFSNSKWGTVFRHDMNLAKAIIFIGYSLYDIDIQRIIIGQSDFKEKCIFIVGDNPSVSEKHIIGKFGRLVVGGHEIISQKISSISAEYERNTSGLRLYSFEEVTISDKRVEIDDESLTKLLLYGEYNIDNIFSSVAGETQRPFYIKRSEFISILNSIGSGKNIHVIYSDLGNGKTLLTEGISAHLLRAGYRVFRFKSYPEYANNDLDQILNLDEKCLIVIENYHRAMPSIELIGTRHCENKIILLTERSSLHEYFSDDLYQIIGEGKVCEYDCNKLKLKEVDEVISLIESAPLWREKSGWSLLKKRKHIQEDLKSELQAVLVDIVESPDMHNRFKSIFGQIIAGSPLQDVIILSLALKSLNYSADSYIISDLIGVSSLSKVLKSVPKDISEIIKLSSNGVFMKSSIVSRYILNNFTSGMFVVDLLIKIANKSYSLMHFNSIYKNIFFDLQRCSVVQTLLPESQKRESLINYFQAIKNIGRNKWSPHFWVQYGIARLSFKDYDLARECFKTAYGYGEALDNFDTYQIDNHYARLIIESSLESRNKNASIDAVRESHKLLMKQMNRVNFNKHYPFRVASSYLDVVNAFKMHLSKDDKQMFIDYSEDFLKKIHSLPYNFAQNRYVNKCKKSMDQIKEMLTNGST